MQDLTIVTVEMVDEGSAVLRRVLEEQFQHKSFKTAPEGLVEQITTDMWKAMLTATDYKASGKGKKKLRLKRVPANCPKCQEPLEISWSADQEMRAMRRDRKGMRQVERKEAALAE